MRIVNKQLIIKFILFNVKFCINFYHQKKNQLNTFYKENVNNDFCFKRWEILKTRKLRRNKD